MNLITARKRSLGQGNIFTSVCHSVHRGGGRAWLLQGGRAWLLRRGGACVLGCSGGACMVARGGACVVLFGGCMVLFKGGMHGFIGGRVWFFQFFRIQ